ncbi:MAG: SCO family protein [Nitrospirae bacterium]|nr:SCO family protein [Nitrospirota bacterium]
MYKIFFIAAFAVLLPINNSVGHNSETAGQEIDVEEKLGEYIPLDIIFYEEDGKPVALKQLINKPTIITPVYLSCTHTCPLLLLGVAAVLGKSKMKPGKDYQILTVSFDENDSPQTAAEKKPGYLKAANMQVPEDSWRFLTGKSESINKFAGATGFKYKKEHIGFSHPVTLIFLSPDGKIVRYLYGVTFLPFEFELAVTEASKGTPVSMARKALQYCISYDPHSRRYVFNTLKIFATLIITAIISFFIYLIIKGKKGISP